MFTLPIDKVVETGPQPLGKQVQTPTWNLSVTITAGTMQNNVWAPLTDFSPLLGSNMNVQIWWGSQCLTDQAITHGSINLSHDLADQGPNRQDLKIVLAGKSSTGPDADIMLRLDIAVENLSIMSVLSNHGQYVVDHTGEIKIPGEYLGENGTVTLNIYTPIYVWLVQNQTAIQQFYQKG